MNTDTSKMAFPMIAITPCTIGRTTHKPEATFDALTQKNADHLHGARAAHHLRTDVAQQAITDSDNQAMPAADTDTLDAPGDAVDPPMTAADTVVPSRHSIGRNRGR